MIRLNRSLKPWWQPTAARLIVCLIALSSTIVITWLISCASSTVSHLIRYNFNSPISTITPNKPVISKPTKQKNNNSADRDGLLAEKVRHQIDLLSDGSIEAAPYLERDDAAEQINLLWRSIGDWAAIYLNHHPDTDAARLQAAIEQLVGAKSSYDRKNDDSANYFDVQVEQLSNGDREAFVISTNWIITGSFFVVAKTAQGDYRNSWNIKDIATNHFALKDELGYWAYLTPGFHDGPLTGQVHRLADGANGCPRFYVDAITHPFMGGDGDGQISIWEWDDQQARPLFIKNYYTDYESYKVTRYHDQLEIHVKEQGRSFYSCGSCSDIDAVWQLKVTPTKVIDLGLRYPEPELHQIDQLLYRALLRRSASGLATASAYHQLVEMLPSKKSDYLLLGMLVNFHTTRLDSYDVSDLRIDSDELPQLSFTFRTVRGRRIITDVSVKE